MTLESLHGESVIVTRGSSGIGRATALLFVEHGACVTIAGVEGRFGYTLEARQPQRRFGAPEEFAAAAVWPCSREMARLIWLSFAARNGRFRSG